MKVIIAGSRDFDRLLLVTWAAAECGFDITEVVSGGALGIDTMGERWAARRNIPVKPFYVSPKDWDRYGKRAGHLRNQKMAEYADALILIWDGCSPGSANMKQQAVRMGLPVHEVVRDAKR